MHAVTNVQMGQQQLSTPSNNAVADLLAHMLQV